MITVDSVTRTYGDFTAVDDVSFSVRAGEIFGIAGWSPTGSLRPSG